MASTRATFSVKNFAKFQHYRDRSPPWIKLFNSLLDDYEFGRLQDASKAHLIAIWLLASRYENRIPLDAEWVGRRINATEGVDLGGLIASGFLIPDQSLSPAASDMLASRKQDACLEGEGEREKEKISLAAQAHPPDGGPADAGDGSESKKPHKGYPEDFEAVWREYRPIAAPNASKANAFKAYRKLSHTESDDCWIGVGHYALWLTEQRKSRPDYPAQHLATFINGRGWEPFLEETA